MADAPPDGTALCTYGLDMQSTRLSIATIVLAVSAGCGNSDDGKSKSGADPTPTVTSVAPQAAPVIDKAKVERTIRRRFLTEFAPAHPGDSLTDVSCPDDISGTIGDETTCGIDFSDGAYGNMTIKVLDDKGRFKIIDANKASLTPPGS